MSIPKLDCTVENVIQSLLDTMCPDDIVQLVRALVGAIRCRNGSVVIHVRAGRVAFCEQRYSEPFRSYKPTGGSHGYRKYQKDSEKNE